MAKVIITLEDKPGQMSVGVSLTFEPILDIRKPDTPAQLAALDIVQMLTKSNKGKPEVNNG